MLDKESFDSRGTSPGRDFKTEFLCISLLLALHPVLLLLGHSAGYFPPDAVQYMSFARDSLANGLLFVEFGYSNQGTILPIVYPTLLLIANFFFNDLMLSAEMVSSYVVLFTSIPLYLIFRRFASCYFSVVAVLLVQLNYQLCLWAVTPLTEATFILVLSWFVYLLFRVLESHRKPWILLLLGICVAIAFLTRQIGLVLFPFALLIIAFASPRHLLKNYMAFTAGFLVLLLPYAAALYGQTGLSIFSQQWSEREEIVLSDLPVESQNKILSIHEGATDDYQDLISGRRALRELLIDNSAMFEEVLLQAPENANSGLATALSLAWNERGQYLSRLNQNVSYLVESLGIVLSLIFFLSLFTPLFIQKEQRKQLPRYIVSGFVLNYLFALSLLSGLIDRYILVLLPFILLHITIEAYFFTVFLKDRLGHPYAYKGLFAVLITAFAFIQPQSVFDLDLPEKTLETTGPFAPFRPLVTAGEPVMALSPLYAHLVNGAWRVMPNDSVANIHEYAIQEGVVWLLVVRGLSDADREISYYQNAIDWYFDQELVSKHQEYLELYANSNDGRIVLFRFKYDAAVTI